MSKTTKKCKRKIKEQPQEQQQQQQQQQEQQEEDEAKEEYERQRLEEVREIHARVESFENLMAHLGWRIYWVLTNENPRPPATLKNCKLALAALMGRHNHLRTPIARTETMVASFKRLRSTDIRDQDPEQLVQHNEQILQIIGASVQLSKEYIQRQCPDDTRLEAWRCLVLDVTADVGSYDQSDPNSLHDTTPEERRLDMLRAQARSMHPEVPSLGLCTRIQVRMLIYNSRNWNPTI